MEKEKEKFKVQLLGEKVLIKPDPIEEKTASGLYIPDTAKEKPQRGTVLEVGSSKDAIDLSIGDIVLYSKYAGTELEINDEKCLLMNFSDLFCILKK